MTAKKLFIPLLAAMLTLSSCSAAKKTEITVFTAASLSNAMAEIASDYCRLHPDTNIVFNSDSSGTLRKQIEEGADCDIFFSAAQQHTDALISEGYIDADTAVPVLENKLVLIKPAGAVTSVTGFENAQLAESIALGDDSVPAGSYARGVFRTLGNYNDVMNTEINECPNVTAVLASISEGANEIGVVYATDAISANGAVEIIAEAPAELLPTPIIYPAALIKNSDAGSEAAEFLKYICSDEAAAVFAEYGFTVRK